VRSGRSAGSMDYDDSAGASETNSQGSLSGSATALSDRSDASDYDSEYDSGSSTESDY